MTRSFDERNAEKSRRVCADMEKAAGTGKRVLTERERRILDMWPRFEDGEPVMIGDEVGDCGESFEVGIIEFYESTYVLDRPDGDFIDEEPYGARVKRPAPKDSWERLEEDAGKQPYDYCTERDLYKDGDEYTPTTPTNERFARDLVRRAKALAGIEED